MKLLRQYGVTKPKSLDYLLAILFSTVAVGALWIGIWIALTKTQTLALEVLGLSIRALTGSFAGANQAIVIVESVVFYGGAFASVILCFLALISKKFKALAGIFAIMLCVCAVALEFGFLSMYFFAEISGLFLVFLLLFILLQLLVSYYVVKLLYSIVVKETRAYESYKSEFVDADNIKIIEVEVPAEEKVEEISEEPQEERLVEEVEPVKENKDEVVAEEKDKFGGANANNYTFEQKLRLAKPSAKQYFKELKQYFESLGFTAELTKHSETFSYKNVKYAMITTAGQNGLKIYYKLNVKDYEKSTIPVKSVDKVKKYEKTPLLFVAKSDLAVKRAKMLMDDVKKQYIGEEVEVQFPKEEVKKQSKPKKEKSKGKKASKPAKSEAKPKEKSEPIEEFIQDGVFGGGKGNNYTFEQKLNMAQPVARKYFKELTKYFVELGFTPAVTKSSQTFSYKNVKYAMITTAGKKGLKIYYKLNPDDYKDSTIPFKNVANVKKYEKTPLLFVAKSDLSIKRAKMLMDDVKAKIK